jgi:hypothetical protein
MVSVLAVLFALLAASYSTSDGRPSTPTATVAHAIGCGTLLGTANLYYVTAHGLSCARALVVARHWRLRVEGEKCTRFRCEVGSFLCVARPPAKLQYGVRCVGRAGVVRFDVFVD